MVRGVSSDNPASQLEATTQFRKLLSIGVCIFSYSFDKSILVIVSC